MNSVETNSHKPDSATLVINGLARRDSTSHKQVREHMLRLARGLGEIWKSASREAAAGMVLLALAQNRDLRQYLNNHGWNLVIDFVTANPEIAKHISPRTIGEILSYEMTSPAA